jgi:hypothetical protein
MGDLELLSALRCTKLDGVRSRRRFYDGVVTMSPLLLQKGRSDTLLAALRKAKARRKTKT